MLLRKMLRDMRLNLTQFISIFLMAILGVFVFTGIHAEWAGMEAEVNRYYEASKLPHLWAMSNNFSKEDVEKITAIPEVKGAARRLTFDTSANLEGSPVIRLNLLTSQGLSIPTVIEGSPFELNAKGLWLEINFAHTHHIRIGDTLSLEVKGTRYDQKVLGFIQQAEYVHNVKDETSMIPDPKAFGYAFAGAEVFEHSDKLPYNQVLITLNNEDTYAAVQSKLENLFDDRYLLQLNRSTHPSMRAFNQEIEQNKALGSIFPVVFFLIAALSMLTTMTRMTSGQRVQIGTLKAMGYANRKILLHYVSYGFWIGLVGGLIGLLTGPMVIPPIMFQMQKTIYSLPKWYSVLSWTDFLAVLLAVLCCSASSYFACKKELNEVPAATLRPKAPKVSRHTSLEKSWIWLKLGFSAQWNIRDILRSRVRSFMAIVGVLGCTALLLFGLGLQDSTARLNQWLYQDLNRFEGKIVLEESASIEQIHAVGDNFKGQWLLESAVEIKTEENRKSGSLTVLDEGDLIKFEDDTRKPLSLSDKDFAITYKMADLLGVEVGDAVTWRIYGERDWHTTTITMLYKTPIGQGIAMTDKAFEEMGFTFKPSVRVTERMVDTTAPFPGVKVIQNKSELIKSMDTLLESIRAIIFILIVAAIALGSIVLYNLGALSFTERTRELATLKVLGFYPKELRALIQKQNLWLTLVGILLGIPCGFAFIGFLLGTMSESMDFTTYIKPLSFIIALLGTLFVSITVNIIQSRRIKGIDMVSSLKSVD